MTNSVPVPEGYEDYTFAILVSPIKVHHNGFVAEWAATIVNSEGIEVEELGIDTSLQRLLKDATRYIKTGEIS